MTSKEMLEKALNDLRNIKGIEASAAVSRDGILIGSTISHKQHADAFVAMSATMFGAAEIAITQLGKGSTNRIIIESKEGKIIATGAGKKALLVVMTRPDANLGLTLVEMNKAAESLKELF